MSRSWMWCAATLVVLAGCVRAEDNPRATCLRSDTCPAGQRCYGGFCIPGTADIDAGMDLDSGEDLDAGCPRAGESCTYSMPGRCAEGRVVCNARGVGVCSRVNAPEPESCNGDDDDCDGRTDESSDVACTTIGCPDVGGVIQCPGVCAPGVQRCVDGELGVSCEGEVLRRREDTDPCTPMGEIAVDDDCDGEIDEDCSCTDGAEIACYTASQESAGIGACALGTATCVSGSFGECTGAVAPTEETCANPGADDDCNGVIDDVAGTGMPCDTGLMGACADGTTTCNTTTREIECIGAVARTEQCDGTDDACDGGIDETFDLTSDDANCGECGRACGMGQTCCDSECVSTQADEGNCGGCGIPCEGGNECCQGMCRVPTAAECTGCPTDCSTMGQTCCQDEQLCVDGMTDSAHCGATADSCGTVCGTNQRCCAGVCVGDTDATCGSCTACATDRQCCGATGAASCVPDLDVDNCLGCGERCASGEACCGGEGCTNLQNDEDNCGRCGNACASGQTCSNGVCCTGSLVGCGGNCVNLLTDTDNCGRCNTDCAFCCSGACRTVLCVL